MGLDGFSISDLRMHQEFTSAQMANKAERIASEGAEFKIKDVDEMAKDAEIKRKEEKDKEKENKKKKDNNQEFENFFSDNADENSITDKKSSEKQEDFVNPFKDKDINEFAVRINSKTEMIELYNKKNKKVMETITADELMKLISKLNSASGILVNKKI